MIPDCAPRDAAGNVCFRWSEGSAEGMSPYAAKYGPALWRSVAVWVRERTRSYGNGGEGRAERRKRFTRCGRRVGGEVDLA